MQINNQSVTPLIEQTIIPKMFQVRQRFDRESIAPDAIAQAIRDRLAGIHLSERLRPGMRVAITAGSRGIANIVTALKTVALIVREHGAIPFIVPAMGSHGGATAEGQVRLLADLGITGESVGCDIVSSMEVARVGTNEEGVDVFIDKNAFDADGIIVVCRVKPHTDFRGRYESGIMKMLAIGLGKQRGAEYCHGDGMENMAKNVPLFGNTIVRNANILAAVALIENAYEETGQIHALEAADIADREPELLQTAFRLMPRLPFAECDLLVVDQIGKNFSGCGMDPNITGTFYAPWLSGGLKHKRVCVLDISDESHGNFSGLGVSDATTRRVFAKADANSTYTNAVTCKVLADAKMPCVMNNDRECIQICLKTLPGNDTAGAKVIRIANSLHIEKLWLSEAFLPEAEMHPALEILSAPQEMSFRDGMLF